MAVAPRDVRSAVDGEVSVGLDGDATEVCAFVFSSRHDGADEVAGLETVNGALALGFGAGEAEGVDQGHLASLSAGGCDVQGLVMGGEIDVVTRGADAGGVDPVGFGIVLLVAIELGSSASAGFDG